MEKNTEWKVLDIEVDKDSSKLRESLRLLACNKVAAVKIPGIYSKEEIDIVIENINSTGVTWYPNFEFKQGRIGICATEYNSKINGKEIYFALEPESSKIRNNIFPGNLDPIKRIVSLFSTAYKTTVAVEPKINNAAYFSGLIRAMKHESTTHFDYAPHQLPEWRVAESEVQFAVVIYLQMPGAGGSLIVYERQWEEDDDKYNQDVKEKGPKGFEESFLEKENSVKITPKEGDMIIFNSRHFHKVEGVDSDKTRFSINSFLSLNKGELFIWN